MWEPYEVKAQTIKTAIESATLLLRIDDIVSGIQKKNKMAPGQSSAPQAEDPDQVCINTGQSNCPGMSRAGCQADLGMHAMFSVVRVMQL